MKTTARELRAGDTLEPDGSEVVGVVVGQRHVEVSLRLPGMKRPTTYTLDPNWPLHRRLHAGEVEPVEPPRVSNKSDHELRHNMDRWQRELKR